VSEDHVHIFSMPVVLELCNLGAPIPKDIGLGTLCLLWCHQSKRWSLVFVQLMV